MSSPRVSASRPVGVAHEWHDVTVTGPYRAFAASRAYRRTHRPHRSCWPCWRVRALTTAALMTGALVSGCAVGPDFVQPAPPAVTGYAKGRMPTTTASANAAGGGAQRLIAGRDVPGEWWRLFRSAAVKSLVEQALKNNPDLQAAQAALRVAVHNTEAQ